MTEFLNPRTQERVQALYRYTRALESGDIDAATAVLNDAEHDVVLERMILEFNNVYQDEDRVSIHPNDLLKVHDFLFAHFPLEDMTEQGDEERAFLVDGKKETQESMQQDLETSLEITPLVKVDRTIPARSSARTRRFSVLLQNIAAVLIVGALLASFIVLFASHRSGPTGSVAVCSIIKNPSVAPSSSFGGVAAISTNDVWAVGSYNSGAVGSKTTGLALIEHWNGSTWSVVSSPQVAPSSILMGVTAVSRNEIWAVGYSFNGSASPLIEHWNGSTWSVVKGADVGASAVLNGITALSANDIWAVGLRSSTGNSSTTSALIEHWDGNAWGVVKSPSMGTFSTLFSVAAAATNDIWAVGNFVYSSNDGRGTLIEHWNGSTWSIVKSPNVGSFSALNAVAVASTKDVWAVGVHEVVGTATNSQALIEHWDGSTWSIVKSPGVGSFSALFGVVGASASDVWFVGSHGESSASDNVMTLIEHWNGSAWYVVNSSNAGRGYNSLLAVALVPGSRMIWSVGAGGPGFNEQRTLTELCS